MLKIAKAPREPVLRPYSRAGMEVIAQGGVRAELMARQFRRTRIAHARGQMAAPVPSAHGTKERRTGRNGEAEGEGGADGMEGASPEALDVGEAAVEGLDTRRAATLRQQGVLVQPARSLVRRRLVEPLHPELHAPRRAVS